MTISIEQAQASLKELIQKSARGETVVITQDQKPVAELRSLGIEDGSQGEAARAWRDFQKVGEELAASSLVGAPSLTEALSQARR